MATLTSAAGQAVSPDNSKKRRRPQGQSSVWRWVVMIIAGVYFLVPLYAALYDRGSYAPRDYQARITAQVRELAEKYGVGRANPRQARAIRSPAAAAAAPAPATPVARPEQLTLL